MTSELSEFGTWAGAPTEGPEGEYAERVREVGSDIVAASYLQGDFTLPSGARSNYYFDKYLFETKPTILRRLAEMISAVLPERVDRVAGAAGGGVALATAVSLSSGLPFVIVRPGQDPAVRGELHEGERVVVITDVVDSGRHALEATSAVAASGGDVVGLIAIIDRAAGGEEDIAAAGIHYRPLYRLGDLDLIASGPAPADDPQRTQRIAQALSAGGIELDSDGSVGTEVGTYSSLADPRGSEVLGAALADLVRHTRPDRVMVWEESDQLVLAHLVSRELDIPSLVAYEASGVLGIAGDLDSGNRVLMVSDAVRGGPFVQQMAALTRNHGANPVGLAVLVDTPELLTAANGIPTFSLAGARHD